MPGETLRVVLGAAAGTEIQLDDTFTLGRTESGDGSLGGDPELSRQHARITIRGGRASLEDLTSKNGSAVNGRHARRSRVALRSGDALALGESVLVYQDECPATLAPASEPPAAAGAARGGPPQPARNRRTAAAIGIASGMLVALAILLALAAAG